MGDWQNLPDDLLTSLAQKILDFSVNIRFSSVCRSWRLAGVQERRRLVEWHTPPGFILIPPGKQQQQQQQPCNSRNFIPLTEIIKHLDKSCTFQMEDEDDYLAKTTHMILPWSLPERSLCIGSFRGWMLVLGYDTQLELRNPVTDSHVSLPMDSRKNINHYEFQAWGFRFSRKVSMWSPNHSFSEWYVFVVMPMEKFLTYCRVGDPDWGIVDFRDLQQGMQNYVVDAVCLDRSLYVLLRLGELYCCDFDSGFEEKKKVACCSQIEAFKYDNRSNYLVEFHGQILLVRRIMDTYSFDVYKLDTELNQWVEVRDLGDFALILGFGQPFSVPTESTELGIKRNCIYFLETVDICHYENQNVSYHIRVFDLKTSSFDVYYINHKFEMPRTEKPVRLPIPFTAVPW